MRILVLTRGLASHSTRRLKEVGARRGHQVQAVDPATVTLGVTAAGLAVQAERGPLAAVDVVMPRFGPKLTRGGLATARELVRAGATAINTPEAHALARDKLAASQVLRAAGVPQPPTAFVTRSRDVRRALDMVGGPPVVVKALEGLGGRGVLLARGAEAAASIVETLTGTNDPVLVQRFVAEAAGRDLRVLVVGGEPVAAMRRHAPPGDFRANAALGARLEAAAPDGRTIDLARAAARALGLDIAGVDILEPADGPLVLEVNASPGFEGLEAASGVDVADAIIRHLEARVARGPTRAA